MSVNLVWTVDIFCGQRFSGMEKDGQEWHGYILLSTSCLLNPGQYFNRKNIRTSPAHSTALHFIPCFKLYTLCPFLQILGL